MAPDAIPTLLEQIDELLAEPHSEGEPATLAHLERTLTDGYAYALALESERWRLEQRLSALAERIADRPHPSRDDLLALALAGWYAGGARQALVRTLLRAGGIDPREPRLTMRRRSQLPGRILPQ